MASVTARSKSKKSKRPQRSRKKPSKATAQPVSPAFPIAVAKCRFCGQELVADLGKWWRDGHDGAQHCEHVVALSLAYEVETSMHGRLILGQVEFEWFTPVLVGGGKLLSVADDKESVASFVAERIESEDCSSIDAQLVRERFPRRRLASGEAACWASISANAIFSDDPHAFLWFLNDDFPGKLTLENDDFPGELLPEEE